ncbi:MAG: hypothetical protein JWO07_561 [Candidatus Saccharibacteria bacterium]|nr:hypothetical protein [Candidatus Saccharibacteria bacterium]
MPFHEKHKIVLDRTEEDGTKLFHELLVSVEVGIVRQAEKGDAMSQEDVIMAFERRLSRERPTLPVPQDLVWSDFQHPIELAT